MTKFIPLTQGKVAAVSDKRFASLSQFHWGYDRGYAARWFYKDGHHHKVYMHRQIKGLTAGDKREVDHKDSDGLNNRDSNLRFSSRVTNSHNTGKHVDNTSGYKGVEKHRKKWSARIMVNGKKLYLGTFDTPELAARARDTATKKHHPKFGRLNFR